MRAVIFGEASRNYFMTYVKQLSVYSDRIAIFDEILTRFKVDKTCFHSKEIKKWRSLNVAYFIGE